MGAISIYPFAACVHKHAPASAPEYINRLKFKLRVYKMLAILGGNSSFLPSNHSPSSGKTSGPFLFAAAAKFCGDVAIVFGDGETLTLEAITRSTEINKSI